MTVTTVLHEVTMGLKRTKKKTMVFAIFVALRVFVMSRAAEAEIIDRVLAVVAGQLITLSDVTAARDLGLQTAEGAADPVRGILSKLIDRELIVTEVDRYAPPEPAPEAIDRETERIRMRFPSAEAFVAALERSGANEKQLREIVRQDLRIRAYLDQRFAAAQERRQALMDDWLSGLRRRGDVVDLYLSGR
jgi:hypothetical protein